MKRNTLIVSFVACVVLFTLTPLAVPASTLNIITVTNNLDETSDNNGCSLREAITNSNDDAQTFFDCAAGSGADEIRFEIGSGSVTITPDSELPAIKDPVTIDGTSQPSCIAPCIVLDGVNAGADTDGLEIQAGDSTIKGLVVQRFGKYGIYIWKRGGNVVVGSYVGTDVTGTIDQGNGLDGIHVISANNRIGGAGEGERNLLSGNGRAGLLFCCSDAASGNTAVNNYVGTNIQGTAAIKNDFFGLGVHSTNNTIGGTTAAERNLLSGNGDAGLEFCCDANASGNLAIGNWIGLDSTGTQSIQNYDAGVGLYAPNNTIGGTTPGERNVISGNRNTGINICCDERANGNVILGNFIGTDAGGTTGVPNTTVGIYVIAVANTTIGGTAPKTGNRIAFNNYGGVRVTTGAEIPLPVGYQRSVKLLRELGVLAPDTGAALRGQAPIQNRIQRNSIYSNQLMGIDIDAVGVMSNDGGDGDAGPNLGQNYPKLKKALSATNLIKGNLKSAPNAEYTVEFYTSAKCDESGFGEGKQYLGALQLTTNNNGAAKFVLTPKKLKPGAAITATATDINGNTSEFSKCKIVS